MKDAKKYKLQAAKKPIRHQLLSGVIHVCDERGRRPAYISFSEEFVDAVGRALPQGLSPQSPAHIKVLSLPGRSTWRIFAMYIKDARGVLLWEAKELPIWAIPVLKSISRSKVHAIT